MTDTRAQILRLNYESIHRFGFQGTRTDKVIADLDITKGAFYHYFANKQELGYAVIDEILAPTYSSLWRQLDQYDHYPLDGIIEILNDIKDKVEEQDVKLGSPLTNLINEMAGLDEGFQTRLASILDEMRETLVRTLRRASDQFQLASLVNPEKTALFIIASVEGSFGVGKAYQSKAAFDQSIDQLIRYIRSIKR